MVLYKKDCQWWKRTLTEKTWESLEGSHTEDTIFVTGKDVTPLNPKQSIHSGENHVQIFCMISQNLWELIKETTKRDCGYGKKKVRGEWFQDTDLREIQELVGTKLEELTEDDSIEMSALEPEPDDEEEDIEEA